MKRLCTAAILALAIFATEGACAQTAQPAPSNSQSGTTVFTRARVVSVQLEAENKAAVRLKLLPRSKIPFTTQTFRVINRSLLADIPEGAWVKFTSRHIGGENVLTAIHVVAECVRFQPCD